MKQTTPPKPKPNGEAKSAPKGQFLTVTTGLQSFIDAIEAKLEPGTVFKGIKVEGIEKHNHQYLIKLSNGEEMTADSVVVATPHHVTQSIFNQYSFFDSFKDMPSTSVATVAMAFPEEAIKRTLMELALLYPEIMIILLLQLLGHIKSGHIQHLKEKCYSAAMLEKQETKPL